LKDSSSQSPEARRKRLASIRAAFGPQVEKKLHPRLSAIEVVKRVATGVWSDGFIHAGNLAFLALLALFPFLIFAAAVAQLIGQSDDAQLAVYNILRQMPPSVADTLRAPIEQVLAARTGPLLWFGAVVGLWTAASFIETIRDILRRAYGIKYCAPFWEYRLWSILLIMGSVFMMFIAFAFSVAISSISFFLLQYFPMAEGLGTRLGLYRLIPGLALFATVYVLFYALTPSRYRKPNCRKWPGALFITLWWLAMVELLPPSLELLGGYDLTYGSLAGVMIALLFFFAVGLGVVMGAELNAALADSGPTALKGEIYSGPYMDELEVEEPQPGEDVEIIVEEMGVSRI
jgi:membrane protein